MQSKSKIKDAQPGFIKRYSLGRKLGIDKEAVHGVSSKFLLDHAVPLLNHLTKCYVYQKYMYWSGATFFG